MGVRAVLVEHKKSYANQSEDTLMLILAHDHSDAAREAWCRTVILCDVGDDRDRKHKKVLVCDFLAVADDTFRQRVTAQSWLTSTALLSIALVPDSSHVC